MPDSTSNLADRIRASEKTHEPVKTQLRTNERVLARITDGIYRRPASALRELVSNAYDADAKHVVILTDAPRFSSIVIRDDGSGLTPDSLAHLVQNIGGSPKRRFEGVELEVTDKDDPNRSPGGRQLIGKMGIGIFSVAQLTRHFLISTKRAGDNFRTIADITISGGLSEQRLLNLEKAGDDSIETGDVLIVREPDSNLEAHGTELKLLDLLPRTRDELASVDWWGRLDFEIETEGRKVSPEPRLHIGRVRRDDSGEFLKPPQLPWTEKDKPRDRFLKFFNAVRDLGSSDAELVDLEKVCDRYLQTLWELALCCPLQYLDEHPFDLTGDDDAMFFQLENRLKGKAHRLPLVNGDTPRKLLNLTAPTLKKGDRFFVEVDGVELFRPIVFREQLRTSTAFTTPLLFLGRCREEFQGRPVDLSRGPLDFEAYLFWTPKVLPTQHQGVIVRVGNASGALFDRTFMGYQVSEQNRLRQITAEIFVREGFDEAINIDRESYNYAHPHYQFLVKWLHSSIRQLTTRHKELGKQLRIERLSRESQTTREALAQRVAEIHDQLGVEDVPDVQLLPAGSEGRAEILRREGVIALRKVVVVPPSTASRFTGKEAWRMEFLEKKVIALTQILHSWGVLENLSFDEQERLVRDILEVTLLGGE